MADEQKADRFEGFDKEVLVVEANRNFFCFQFFSSNSNYYVTCNARYANFYYEE